MNDGPERDPLDRATASRLHRLSARAVETARLERRVEAAMREALGEASGGARAAGPLRFRRWWVPVTGAAAAVLVALVLAVVAIDGGASPARAAPVALAQLHRDLSSGGLVDIRVSSVDEANALLAKQARGAAPVPELPGLLKSCCLTEHAGATLTVALIERDGRRISVAVADGGMIYSPEGETIHRGGRRLVAHAAGGVRMVMARNGERWLCVMGEAGTDELAEIAVAVRF